MADDNNKFCLISVFINSHRPEPVEIYRNIYQSDKMSLFNKIIKSAVILSLMLTTLSIPCLADETADNSEYYDNNLPLWREPITGQEFVWVKGGCFMMGQSPQEKTTLIKDGGELKYREFYADETPQHKICLDGFWLARHEVTKSLWGNMMATTPFSVQTPTDHPATNISWLMAMDFIVVLNDFAKGLFRLPTEAELEYATRAGTATPFHTGETISTDQANFNGSYPYGTSEKGVYLETTTPGGSYPANQFGLFDTHGNVWEWCSDWYAKDYYQHGPSENPQGPVTGKKKVLRGGSWFTAPRSVRAANRRGLEPDATVEDAGFRLVVTRAPPKKKAAFFNPNF